MQKTLRSTLRDLVFSVLLVFVSRFLTEILHLQVLVGLELVCSAEFKKQIIAQEKDEMHYNVSYLI